QPFVRSVAPLAQVVADSRLLAEAREAAGLERTRRRAAEHAREPVPGELRADRPCLAASALGQRDVGAAGVTARAAPLRLAVTDENDVERGIPPQSSSSVSGPSE